MGSLDDFGEKLIETKRAKFLEVVRRACDEMKLPLPTVNFEGCPKETEDQLAHYHPESNTICVSRIQLYKLNFVDIERTATHEVTHIAEQGHGPAFQQKLVETRTRIWRPPLGVQYTLGERSGSNYVRLRRKKHRGRPNRCHYHFCKMDGFVRCAHCGEKFCKDHAKPSTAGFGIPTEMRTREIHEPSENESERGHPCIPWTHHEAIRLKAQEIFDNASVAASFGKHSFDDEVQWWLRGLSDENRREVEPLVTKLEASFKSRKDQPTRIPGARRESAPWFDAKYNIDRATSDFGTDFGRGVGMRMLPPNRRSYGSDVRASLISSISEKISGLSHAFLRLLGIAIVFSPLIIAAIILLLAFLAPQNVNWFVYNSAPVTPALTETPRPVQIPSPTSSVSGAEPNDMFLMTYSWYKGDRRYDASAYLSNETYSYYLSKPRGSYYGTLEDYFLGFVNDNEQQEAIAGIADQLRQESTGNDDAARAAISFTQSIPYDYFEFYNGGGRQRYPYETLYENKGVCGDKALLAAALLKHLGYGVALFYYPSENHMALGLKCPRQYAAYGSDYCFVEVSSGMNRVTEIPDEYAGGITLTSIPQIIPISDGNSFYTASQDYSEAQRHGQVKAQIDQLYATISTSPFASDYLIYEYNSLVSEYMAYYSGGQTTAQIMAQPGNCESRPSDRCEGPYHYWPDSCSRSGEWIWTYEICNLGCSANKCITEHDLNACDFTDQPPPDKCVGNDLYRNPVCGPNREWNYGVLHCEYGCVDTACIEQQLYTKLDAQILYAEKPQTGQLGPINVHVLYTFNSTLEEVTQINPQNVILTDSLGTEYQFTTSWDVEPVRSGDRVVKTMNFVPKTRTSLDSREYHLTYSVKNFTFNFTFVK